MLRQALRAAFAVLATFLSLPAADCHVLPEGNDVNPGPAPRPLRALAAARDCLLEPEDSGRDGLPSGVGDLIRAVGPDGVLVRGETLHGIPSPAPFRGGPRGANHHFRHCGRLVGYGRGVCLHSAAANQVSHSLAEHVPRCGICGPGAPHVASTQNKPPCDSVLSFCNTHRVNQDARDAGSVFFHTIGKRFYAVGGKP